MRKLKKIFRVLLTIVSLVLTLFLANVDIQAEEDSPEITINFHERNPLFYEFDIYPGDTFDREVGVDYENGEEEMDIFIGADEIQTVGNLSDVLLVTVTGGQNEYSGTLTNLYYLNKFRIDTIKPGDSRNYNVSVYFEKDAGNEYMNKLTIFDYSFLTFSTEDGTVLGSSDENLPENGSILGVTGQFVLVGVGVGSLLVLSYVLPKILRKFSKV